MDHLKVDVHPLFSEPAVSALHQEGIITVRDFIFCDSQKLAKISLLVFKEIIEIKKYLVNEHGAQSETAYGSYVNSLRNSAIIPSGVPSIDQLLEGGLFTSNVYEICGRAASGKSLLAYIFMRNLVLEMKRSCFLLDTKNDFCADKFTKLCKGYATDDILRGLEKIYIKHIKTRYDLLNSLHEIAENLEKKVSNVRMIIIDSIATVILDNNDHSQNNLMLTHLANLMHYIASKFYIVILVLNLVTAWVETGGFSTKLTPTETISCGRFWYGIPNSRMKLEKHDGYFKLNIEKSNLLPVSCGVIAFKDVIQTS